MNEEITNYDYRFGRICCQHCFGYYRPKKYRTKRTGNDVGWIIRIGYIIRNL